MPSLQRLFSICAITLAAAVPQLVHAEETAAQMIVGKWRHESMVRVIDGQAAAPQKSDGKTSAIFSANGTWTMTSAANVSGGTYKWIDGQRLEQTVLESGLAIQVGTVSVKEIRVTEKTLEVITRQTRAEMDKFMPPVKAGVRRPNEVVITSVFARDS